MAALYEGPVQVLMDEFGRLPGIGQSRRNESSSTSSNGTANIRPARKRLLTAMKIPLAYVKNVSTSLKGRDAGYAMTTDEMRA